MIDYIKYEVWKYINSDDDIDALSSSSCNYKWVERLLKSVYLIALDIAEDISENTSFGKTSSHTILRTENTKKSHNWDIDIVDEFI